MGSTPVIYPKKKEHIMSPKTDDEEMKKEQEKYNKDREGQVKFDMWLIILFILCSFIGLALWVFNNLHLFN